MSFASASTAFLLLLMLLPLHELHSTSLHDKHKLLSPIWGKLMDTAWLNTLYKPSHTALCNADVWSKQDIIYVM